MSFSLTFAITTGALASSDGIVGGIASQSAKEGTIQLGSTLWSYRVYGPFGQGYNISVSGQTGAILSYHWQDGAYINPTNSRGSLVFSQNVLYVSGASAATVEMHEGIVFAALDNSLPTAGATPIGLLMILDAMWRKRVGMFRRG